MITAYRYAMYPADDVQRDFLNRSMGCQRWTYNHFLELQIARHKAKGTYLTYDEMSAMLPALKDEHSWLGETNSQSLQQTLKLLEKAIEAKEKANAIRKARGEETKNPYPRFRCKGRSESFIVPQHFSLTKTRAKIPKLPTTLRYVKHRFFVGRPKRLIIAKEGDRYYLIVVCERRDVPAVPPEAETAVGIDMGVKLLYAASDGECVDPIDLDELERRKRILQKELKRRTLRNADGTLAAVQSKGRGRTKKELSRVCRKIRNKRGDVHGRCVKRLAERHGCVFAEDLGIGNMTKRAHDKGVAAKSGLNKAILNQGWGGFLARLERKCVEKGKTFLRIPPAYTSQTCNRCGRIDAKSRRTQSEFRCTFCGHEDNADVNAAKNILKKGLETLGLSA